MSLVILSFFSYNNFMKKLIVNKKYNGKKLNKFLLDNIPNLSFGLFCNILRKKDIKINGKRTNKDIIVFDGDEILVYISDDLLNNQNSSFDLEIIYEDNNILVINKPDNLEVTGNNSLTTLVHKNYSNLDFKPMPCHRLDRNTTGLVLFAKNEQALEILLNKFKNHEIEKHYLAWVYGIPNVDYKRVQSFLFKDNKKSMVYISDSFKKGYVKIITSFSVLEKRANNTSILDVEIETGKTHQIRAHLAFLGFPIIGDGKYGKNDINKKFGRKFQALCSYMIKFNFSSDSGILNYLNSKCIRLKTREMEPG